MSVKHACNSDAAVRVQHLEVIRLVKVAAVANELSLLAADFIAAVDLMLVDGNTSYIGTSGANDAAQGAADAAAHVKHTVVVLDVKLCGDPVLRVEYGHAVGLMPPAEAKVKRVAPAVFVEVAGEVVKGVCDVAVVCAVLIVAADFGIRLIKFGGILSARHALPHDLEQATDLLSGIAAGYLVQEQPAQNQ